MSVEKNKALVRRWFGMEDFHGITKAQNQEAEIARIMDKVVEELFAPDFVLHTSQVEVRVPDFKQANIMRMIASPDTKFTIDDIVAEDDKVAIRYTVHDIHKDDLWGIPASGKQVAITGMSFMHITDGKFTKAWMMTDTLGLIQQLGGIPAMGRV